MDDEDAADDFSFNEYINTENNKQNITREITTLARYTKEFVFMITDAAGNLLITDDYADPATFRQNKIDPQIVNDLVKKRSYQAETTLGGMFAEPYLVHEGADNERYKNRGDGVCMLVVRANHRVCP